MEKLFCITICVGWGGMRLLNVCMEDVLEVLVCNTLYRHFLLFSLFYFMISSVHPPTFEKGKKRKKRKKNKTKYRCVDFSRILEVGFGQLLEMLMNQINLSIYILLFQTVKT